MKPIKLLGDKIRINDKPIKMQQKYGVNTALPKKDPLRKYIKNVRPS